MNFCLKPHILYHWQQILSVVFLEVTGSVGSFLRKRLPKTQVWITIVCQLFFQVKMAFYEKVANLAHNLNSCLSDFPGDNYSILVYGRNALCVPSILSHRILKYMFFKKRCVLRAPDLIKLIFFTTSSSTFFYYR